MAVVSFLPPSLPSPLSPPYTQPFVLLDDASAGSAGMARLYGNPDEIIIARHAAHVADALARIDELARAGRHLAGYIAYEAGLTFEPRLARLAEARSNAHGPLVWFGAFAGWKHVPVADLAAHAPASPPAGLGPLEPAISPGAYACAFAALKDAITAGDIYQANFTLPLVGGWQGDPLALYAALRAQGGGAHGGVVFDGSHWLLSFSPELFFHMTDGNITAKPMKGTRPRGATPQADAAFAAELAASPKDRAENLMITDLIRNDLARVAMPGSVQVIAPFTIESYPTVHQMVSTVRARLAEGIGTMDLIRAIFPCGSVTGAPKIRAMELINLHERHPRGAYCGAIGHIDPSSGPCSGPSGNISFNVAIRTLRLSPAEGDGPSTGGRAVLGVGSAIVADSESLPEWRECLVKGGFVSQPSRQEQQSGHAARFDLIETMRFTPEDGVPLLELHLQRIYASAQTLGFLCDRHHLRNAIQTLCFEAESPSRLRLLLARSGATSLEITPLPPPLDSAAAVPCVVLPLPMDAQDWRLAHKTTDRGLYDAGLAAGRMYGAHETLFLRDDGLVTEGCFTTLFVERDGTLLTPPAHLGLLPGVLRRSLIEQGRAREATLTLDDLANGFLIGNALRGLMRAQLLN